MRIWPNGRKGRTYSGDIMSTARTRDLTRILECLSNIAWGNKSRIAIMSCVNPKVVDDGLHWLVRHDMILKKTGECGVVIYSQKPKGLNI